MSLLQDAQSGGLSTRTIQAVIGEAIAYLRADKLDAALASLGASPALTWNDAFACYLTALILVNLGQDAPALEFCGRALVLKPDGAEALDCRARILIRQGRFEEAIAAYESLFRFSAAGADTLCNAGRAFEAAARTAEALQLYERSLKAAPGHVPALEAKALLLHSLGRDSEAFETCRRLAAAEPDDAGALYNCGAIFAAKEEHAEALDCFEKALRRTPNYAQALYGAAASLQKLGRHDEALEACDRVVAETPRDFKAVFLRGTILFDLRRVTEALAAFDASLALDPADRAASVNRGFALRQLGRFDEAAQMFDAVLAANPRSVEALLGRGIVQFKSGQADRAIIAFESALEADPACAKALCGRGICLLDLGRFPEAMADFERALALGPGLVEGHSNLGALQLLLGDFERGWEGYEYRQLAGNAFKPDADARWPVWNGEAIAGKKILILDEAAHGDTFLLARYFPMLAALGAEATYKCRPRMRKLLEQVPGVRLATEIGPDETFDYQVHLFSLPRAFKTRLGSIPAPAPYLKADPAAAAKWARRIGEDGFKIGIVWQGNPDPNVDMARAAPLCAFAPLAEAGNVRLISLQKGAGSEQIAASGLRIETLGEDFDAGPDAFIDTAAVIANLDLAVTVDTSVAHLAGAMGRPVWVALKSVPEWRWMLGREDSPWYPTMRLFRQCRRGDWSGVFHAMAKAVEPLAAAKSAAPHNRPILIPAAVGDLIDKLTILEIKSERIPDPDKRANVERELALLGQMKASRQLAGSQLDGLAAQLKSVNCALWDIEDAVRGCERLGDFGPNFVELARSVYKENDKRAALKREINSLFNSVIVEEKYFLSGHGA